MKRVLLTGVSGFIGKNIKDILETEFILHTPLRSELDLRNASAVRRYIIENNINIVLHCANPNPVKNSLDNFESMTEDSIRIFMNFYECKNIYEKMFYLGSGAEYDKTMDISEISEDQCFRSIPKDSYGFAKYVMNLLAHKSSNIYNLCVFGCYGPGDHSSKFISHCINCCKSNRPITINQDCKFDFIHVLDLGNIILWMCKNNPRYFMYNITSDSLYLSEIADIIKIKMKSDQPIIILKEGLNFEYTGSNKRLLKELGKYNFINIEDGIEKQIQSELQKG